jgi:putative molybdopterin biosynthesis protein
VGANVRAAGEHLAAGQPLLAVGRVLTPFDLAIAIAGGHARVPVHRRPRVAIVPTGDELRPAGAPLEPGAIHDSNGPMIAAQVRQAGAEARLEERSGDDPEAIAGRIAAAAARSDLVLLLGGSSRGRRDHAGAALARVGEVSVDGVAIRPGHPVLLGVAGTTPVVGVPGYPLAAAVVIQVFALPLLRTLRGLGAEPPGLEVELAEDVDGRPGADSFVPLRVDRRRRPPGAWALGRKGSDIASLAAADALLRVPPGQRLAAGAVVEAEALGGLPGAER